MNVTENTNLVELAVDIGVDRTCKALGLEGLREAVELSGQSKQNLRNWIISDKPKKHKAFVATLLGAVELKRRAQNAD